MVQPPEILVHISAPSRIVDDARYRKEALGILGFEAVATHTLLASNSKRRGYGAEALDTLFATDVEEGLLQRKPDQTALQGSGKKHEGVRKRRAPVGDTISTTPGTSTLGASLFLQGRTPIPLLPRPNATKSPFIHVERTPAVERPRTAPTSSGSSQEASSLRRTQSDSWEPPPSIVPDSQPSYRPLKRGITSSSPSPTHRGSSPSPKRWRQSSSPAFYVAPSAHDSPLPVALKPKVEVFTHIRSSPPPPTSFKQVASPLSSNLHFPIEIHPPRPPPGTAHFKTHLTLSLTSVSAKLAGKYRPASQVRPLDPLERGHWLFSTAAFPLEIKKKFWDWFAVFLNEGRAGWGVWCIRERETVKVYCWGEVVKDVWCVLFLASHRKISGVGASWVDSGGKVVVQMS